MSALETLWDIASNRAGLTDEELEFIAGGHEEACDELGRLAHVVEGIACLVLADKDVGSFRERDALFNLLVNISNTTRALRTEVDISYEANYLLQEKRLEAAKQVRRE